MSDNKRVVLYEHCNWKVVREYDESCDTGVKGEPNGYQGWVEYYGEYYGRSNMLLATGSCNMVSNKGEIEDDRGRIITVPKHVLNAIHNNWDALENYSEEQDTISYEDMIDSLVKDYRKFLHSKSIEAVEGLYNDHNWEV